VAERFLCGLIATCATLNLRLYDARAWRSRTLARLMADYKIEVLLR
jgi:hypothetical protein